MPDLNDLEDDFRELQSMHDVEHRKEVELEKERYGPVLQGPSIERIFFMDGTGTTPGSEKCKCGSACEFPCWQRLGIAPACVECGCPPLPDEVADAA